MHIIWIRLLLPLIYGAVLGVSAMLLHECGHLAAAATLGVRVKRVGVHWKKGFFTVRERGTIHQNLLIAISGPLVNLALVALEPWFPLFTLANVCCLLANTLPIEGSDGLRVADCWRKIREGETAN